MFVAVACGFVEELLVNECQKRALGLGPDQYGHERLALWHRAPSPGEDEFLVRHHVAIGAADVMLLAILGMKHDGIFSAPPHIELGLLHRSRIRAEPFDQFFGVRPRGVDFFRRRMEATFEGKAWLDGDAGLRGHGSFSTNAARRSSCSDQKRW